MTDEEELSRDKRKMGKRLSIYRKKRKLSQSELGLRVGIGRTVISKFENGRGIDLGVSILMSISKELNVSLEEIICGTENADILEGLTEENKKAVYIYIQFLRKHQN